MSGVDPTNSQEYARGHIGQEELHVIEMNKLLRDYSIV